QAPAAQHAVARAAGAAAARRPARRRAQSPVRRRAADPVLMWRWGLALALLVSPAAAAELEDAAAYCTFARAVANSESALTFSPQLFLDYGLVNGNDVTTGSGGLTAGPPVQLLTVGARWSLTGLNWRVAHRGLAYSVL